MTKATLSKLLTVISIAVLATAPVWAQGRGRGRGRGAGGGWGAAAVGAPALTGNWGPGWTRWVKPQNEQEQKFVDEVISLHTQVRAKRIEVAQLRAGADSKALAAKTDELAKLRERLYKFNETNRELHWKMVDRDTLVAGQTAWYPGRGRGAGAQSNWMGRGRGRGGRW